MRARVAIRARAPLSRWRKKSSRCSRRARRCACVSMRGLRCAPQSPRRWRRPAEWGPAMVRFLKALVLLPIAVLVVLIAVANRGPVQVSLDPFSKAAPEIAFSLPLFALIFAAVILGVLIGGCAAWLAQGRHRRERRRMSRDLQMLRG